MKNAGLLTRFKEKPEPKGDTDTAYRISKIREYYIMCGKERENVVDFRSKCDKINN